MTETLEQALRNTASKATISKPVIYDLSAEKNRLEVNTLLKNGSIQHVTDDFEEQLRELFAINNPTRVYTSNFKTETESNIEKLVKEIPLWQRGNWAYFPWISTIAHILPEADFQRVRTARNRNLITEAEQQKFYNSTVGIGGLSVGNSVALAIVLQGGAKRIRLADFDRLALSNTNRVRAGVENLGVEKVEVTARQIYTLNPYAIVEIVSEGLTPENIESFFTSPTKLDIVIDELDNLAVKFLIREQAKKHGLAVVMAADNGDNAVVDIERYDLDRNTPFFHGRMGEVSYEMLKNLDKFGIGKMITKHIGAENVTEAMQKSLLEMGKTIVSWPQLGGAALINGAAVAYCVRRILNSQPIEDNRALIAVDEKLIPGYNDPSQQAHRTQIAKSFKKIFGL